MSDTGNGRTAGWILLLFVVVLSIAVLAAYGGVAAWQTAAAAFPPTGPDLVNAQYLEFQPATLEVPVGTTVTWTNHDETAYLIAADDGSFTSVPLSPGDSFSHTFDKPGTYAYTDQIQGYIHGKVVVR